MERKEASDKYSYADYYLLENLSKEYKDKECNKNLFNKNNIFISTKNKYGKFCQNVYEREPFKKKYDFIIVENNYPDYSISKIINKIDPYIGILLPKNTKYDGTEIKKIIEHINNNNQNNEIERLLKIKLNNYNFQLRDSNGKSYDRRYGIISSNNNFQQQNYYNNNNIYNSGFHYNQNNNNKIFNQNTLKNAGNFVVNANNNFNANNNNYNNYSYPNQNNFINMNNNQASNNFNIINSSINLNSNNNNGNIFSNMNQNQNQINNQNYNNANLQDPSRVPDPAQNPGPDKNNQIYLFPTVGLNNIGSTCYMNATLQCLLHVSELTLYFLREYSNDKNSLKEKNKLVESNGEISNAFYKLVKGVCEDEYNIKKNTNLSKQNGSKKANLHGSVNTNSCSSSLNDFEKLETNLNSPTTVISHRSVSPNNFKSVLGRWNSQFQKFEANDSKDLILYLMQTMHEELNYFGGSSSNNFARPNQYDKISTFMYFMNTYNAQNFSIISNIFYGTYENATLCHKCRNLLFNYQKFEFISFGMFDYKNIVFNIYNGFEDNSKPQLLTGENQFYCNTCKKLEDAEITSKIIQPPNKLIINIDYGKNKAFKPSQVKFDEIIDITNYVCFDFGAPIRYKIMGVCTHLGSSGSYGHYIAYCKHRETGQWYNFNDSSVRKCNQSEIYGGSPYLLLYEKI